MYNIVIVGKEGVLGKKDKFYLLLEVLLGCPNKMMMDIMTIYQYTTEYICNFYKGF